MMGETRVAKLFKNGASQAVRLPADFRFDGKEVYISRDERTGDVILSARPGISGWADFFEFMDRTDVPEDFMRERPMNTLPVERNLFDEQD
ncbi:MAG TPA: AbrB/MazE/SpoVT family DNA-binding domain-containing protein [Phyllobacterium sp.]|jgi:antitoxin VapB|nr:AbrB/MazE/SpoVT family DNA-binding domain-containing protein [Phyllobacterium sp.]